MPNLELHGFGQKYGKGVRIKRGDLLYLPPGGLNDLYKLEQELNIPIHELEFYEHSALDPAEEAVYIATVNTRSSSKAGVNIYKYNYNGDLIWRIVQSASSRSYHLHFNPYNNKLYLATESVMVKYNSETGAEEVTASISNTGNITFTRKALIFYSHGNENVAYDAETLEHISYTLVPGFRFVKIHSDSKSGQRSVIGGTINTFKVGFVMMDESWNTHYKEFDLDFNEIYAVKLANTYGANSGVVFKDDLIMYQGKASSGSSSWGPIYGLSKTTGLTTGLRAPSSVPVDSISSTGGIDPNRVQLRGLSLIDLFFGFKLHEFDPEVTSVSKIGVDFSYVAALTVTDTNLNFKLYYEATQSHQLT